MASYARHISREDTFTPSLTKHLAWGLRGKRDAGRGIHGSSNFSFPQPLPKRKESFGQLLKSEALDSCDSSLFFNSQVSTKSPNSLQIPHKPIPPLQLP